MIDGKLYLFMHSVMDNKTLPAPYQFRAKAKLPGGLTKPLCLALSLALPDHRHGQHKRNARRHCLLSKGCLSLYLFQLARQGRG